MINSNQLKTYALAATAANKKLAAELESAGARIIRFPQIETEAVFLDEKSTAFLNEFDIFDWLIFQDVFAADYFLSTLEESGRDFYELDRLGVCTLGEAVADRLRFVQIHADVIPHSVNPAVAVDSLAAYIGDSEISLKNFLSIERRSASESEIEGRLKELGASVSRLEIYAATISDADENARIKALLAGGAADEIIFAAPADFFALEEFLTRLQLEEIMRETKILATDEITAQFLRERDVKTTLFRRR